MALARKCDICGSLYEAYNEIPDRETENPNTIRFGNKDMNGGATWDLSVDCCPECISSIRAHIESLKHK